MYYLVTNTKYEYVNSFILNAFVVIVFLKYNKYEFIFRFNYAQCLYSDVNIKTEN